MSNSFETLVQGLECQASKGASAPGHDILRALRIEEVRSEISRYLDQQCSVTACVRVYRTCNPEWVEVLVRLASPATKVVRPPEILVTFDGTNGQLISLSKEFGQTRSFPAQSETLLPFALAAPSFTEAVRVTDDDPNLLDTNARRREFFQNLAPMICGSQTAEPTTDQTPDTTWNTTTPNDNDTITDWRADVRTDWKIDP